MTKKLLTPLVVLLSFLACLFAEEELLVQSKRTNEAFEAKENKPRFFVGFQNWAVDHTIDFELTASLLLASDVDAERDLNVDLSESTPRIFIGAELGDWRVAVSGYRQKLKGQSSLTREITIRDVTFTVGNPVTTKINIEEYTLDFEKNFYENGWLHVDGVLAGEYYSFEIDARAAQLQAGESETAFWPAPGLVVRAQLPWNIQFENRFKGISGKVSSTSLTHFDYVGRLTYQINSFDLELGYRHFQLDGSGRDFTFDVKSSGPYVGVSWYF